MIRLGYLFLFTLSLSNALVAQNPLIPDVNPFMVDIASSYAIMINQETGAVLYAKGANERIYPASTTKIATALYSYKFLKNRLDEMVTIQPSMIGTVSTAQRVKSDFKLPTHWIEVGGSHIGLKKNEQMSIRDLYWGLMIVSGNDAANALVLTACDSYAAYNLGVNSYLQSIGCRDTHFVNAHGHHHPEHYSTVYDLLLMSRELIKEPFLKEIVAQSCFIRPETNKQKSVALAQSNKLLRSGKYKYPKATGIKTGSGNEGASFVASAEGEHRKLLLVVSGTKHKENVFEDAIALFNAAFSECKHERVLVSKGRTQFERKIKDGSQPLKTYLKKNLSIKMFSSEEEKVTGKVIWDSLVPPVKKNQKVGKVAVITSKGEILQEEPLFSENDISPTWKFEIIHSAAQNPRRFGLVSFFFLLSVLTFGFVLRCRR
jgi:serine-type D-Ala-D-Ala carboxypeptidase (penicillin-binding protein 5/6)